MTIKPPILVPRPAIKLMIKILRSGYGVNMMIPAERKYLRT
jgi:hypothetical protein